MSDALPEYIFIDDHASDAVATVITGRTTAASIHHADAICGDPTVDANACACSRNGDANKLIAQLSTYKSPQRVATLSLKSSEISLFFVVVFFIAYSIGFDPNLLNTKK